MVEFGQVRQRGIFHNLKGTLEKSTKDFMLSHISDANTGSMVLCDSVSFIGEELRNFLF